MRDIKTDEETECKVIELYASQRLPTQKVGKELGIGETTVRRILRRNGVLTRSKSEAMTRFPKRDFSNDQEEAAAMIATKEDCDVRWHFKKIHVRTYTTHLPMISMLKVVFGDYGCEAVTSKYHSWTGAYPYAWDVRVGLNKSFQFLLDYKIDPVRYLEERLEPK